MSHVKVIDERAAWLAWRQRNDTSQFGEDGLIEAVLEQIGETNRWCFEVGAADGLFFSNTKRLRDQGWYAVLIEADERQATECRKFASSKVTVVHESIGSGSLDAILARCQCPTDPDLGVIDIDGQDYWVFEGLQTRPRILLVEFGYWNTTGRVPPKGSKEVQDQAGLDTICDLGRRKGYCPVVHTYCNVLFVDAKVWESSSISVLAVR